jgi:hypothetical protein
MTCTVHQSHNHVHGDNCGHIKIKHNDHVDYLHDNHLHHVHNDHIDEHKLEENALNTSSCTPNHACVGHNEGHIHGQGCGHEAIPHGNHSDYIVDGHLHSPHEGHCDHHGIVGTN